MFLLRVRAFLFTVGQALMTGHSEKSSARLIHGFILAGLWFMASANGIAWEEDVHYILTFWLAERAGFSRPDADLVARGDQSRDDSKHNDAISTVIWVMFTGDEEAARKIQLYHFPHDATLPSPPDRRVVAPNNAPAREAVEKEVLFAKRAATVRSLGEALHPFQDSWSHQGVPDIPLNLRKNLISAHPADRGGWRSHDADLTPLHIEEALDMARETYELLKRYLAGDPKRRMHPAASWASLEPTVRDFAKAESRDAKSAWARRNIPQQTIQSRVTPSELTLFGRSGRPPEVRSLSLPQRRRPPAFPMVRLVPVRMISQTTPTQLQSVNVDSFFSDWLQHGDVAGAAARIDWEKLANQFEGDPFFSSQEPVIQWCRKFLAMQLLDDHALANRLGHGDPKREGYPQLPEDLFVDPRAGSSIATLPKSVQIRPADFVPTDIAGEPGLGVILSFSSLPHDSLGLVWQRSGDQWRIVRMFSVVE